MRQRCGTGHGQDGRCGRAAFAGMWGLPIPGCSELRNVGVYLIYAVEAGDAHPAVGGIDFGALVVLKVVRASAPSGGKAVRS